MVSSEQGTLAACRRFQPDRSDLPCDLPARNTARTDFEPRRLLAVADSRARGARRHCRRAHVPRLEGAV